MSSKYQILEKIERTPNNLIKGLQKIQACEGYVSDEAILAIGEYFEISPVEVEGVLTFYSQFKRVKPGKYKVAICDGTACHIKGSNLIEEWVATELGIKVGQTSKDGLFSLESVACLGCCSLAPVMSVNGRVYGKLDRKNTIKILKELAKNG